MSTQYLRITVLNLADYKKEIDLIVQVRTDIEVEGYVDAQRKRYQKEGKSFDDRLAELEKNKMPLHERVKHEALTGDARREDNKQQAAKHIASLKTEIAADKREELVAKLMEMGKGSSDDVVSTYILSRYEHAKSVQASPEFRQNQINLESTKLLKHLELFEQRSTNVVDVGNEHLGRFTPAGAIPAVTNRIGQRVP
jgi:hypothetical protein